MKTLRTIAKITTVALVFCLIFAFTSCDIFKGSLELESFTVDRSTVKTVYFVGEEIDFSGIKATVKYSDESLNTEHTIESLSISYADDITATAGTKDVTVTFVDPHLGTIHTATVQITVKEDPNNVTPPNPDEPNDTVAQFEKNENLTAFDSDNNTEGKHEYGETGFSGEFINGGILYVIGDDNAFEMVPTFAVETSEGLINTLSAFYSVVDIYVLQDGEYVLLDKTENTATSYTYSLGGETLVTVDTFYGEYRFAKPIDQVKISVMPSAEHYDGAEDVNPVVLEAKVIDAYNVYEAWQLAVIDNNSTRTDWDVLKTEKGIKDVNPAGIVLHADISILAEDAPASFFDLSTRDVTYFNNTTNETKVYPAGTHYFKDGTALYSRLGADDFVIQGNFFNISAKDFPVVPSNGVFDSSLDLGYGSDFSNAVLFHFETLDDSWLARPDDVSAVTIENLAIIGNASQDFWQEESDEGLLTAGGLILIKSSRHAEVTLNNVINNSFFISYFPDYQSYMTVNSSKCYDSYQNAVFAWSEGNITVNDSFINGAGGPIVIAMSVKNNDNVQFNPTVKFNNTVVEGHLTGSEIWFTAVNATAIVDSIKALGAGMHGAGLGNFVDSNGKMNIEAVLMPESTDASAAVTEVTIQGTLDINGVGIERWYEGEKADLLWSTILGHPAFAQGAPFLSVEDADGNVHTVFFNGTTFCDLMGNALGTDASHQALVAAFMQADHVTLSQGGLSVVFEFYHY